MEYEWIKTTASVYRAIYEAHKGDFTVFESYTNNCFERDALKTQITAWGFNDAEHPIIKSELRDHTEWTYSLLMTARTED
tara:strand:+ start:261 stop:500 length:240 start_codon:yes stop_codon:yes gene_type:complete